MKSVSPKKFEEFPEETKEDISKLGKHLRGLVNRPYLFNRTLATICEKMYMEGMAAAMDGEVVEQGRCIKVDRGTAWDIVCPYCGEKFDIDLEGMLPTEEGYGVKT